MKSRSELILWRVKHLRDGIKRPWEYRALGLLLLAGALMVACAILLPAFCEGKVLAPIRGHLEVKCAEHPLGYWCSVIFYTSLAFAGVGASVWLFRCAAILARCVQQGIPGDFGTVTIKKLYNYPAHAVRIFDRVVQEQAARGHSLRSLRKDFLFGTGASLRFEFADAPATMEQRLTYYYGQRRGDSDSVFNGWRVATVLPMRTCWITIGYFYVLQREQKQAAWTARCSGPGHDAPVGKQKSAAPGR
jgi:hypothetical protein